MMDFKSTDVLVVGAGPVGLLTALGLAQQGIDTIIIEKRELEIQETFGRAISLFPRTLEILEQVGVAEDLLQTGNIVRGNAIYRDGKRSPSTKQQAMFTAMSGTFHNYFLNIRQKQSQAIFAAKYKAVAAKQVQYQWELVDYHLDNTPGDSYNITATVSHVRFGNQTIRCKYLVGADGAQSQVRRLADIPMLGDNTAYEWVRLDGRIKTDIPDIELGIATVETKSYGNVVIAKLDKDVSRVGFVYTPTLRAKYPDGLTKEQALEEAIKCVQPFHLEFERLDWWITYTIRQKVAKTLRKDEFVFLAGDAAHTHSSGLGQGMNTGVHDACNLAWKLAGTLKGWYNPEVLDTYGPERRAVAQKVIDIDRITAAVMSGDVPPEWAQKEEFDVNKALADVISSNASFNIGLGVSYEPSVLVGEATTGSLVTGQRGPDVLLRAPGPSIPTRLQTVIHSNLGRWNILVFAGRHLQLRAKLTAFREALSADKSVAQRAHLVRLITIVAGTTSNTWEVFDGPPPGPVYFDEGCLAHDMYGISGGSGGLVILRPDGIVASVFSLEEGPKAREFLETFCT